MTDRSITEITTVQLDASDSTPNERPAAHSEDGYSGTGPHRGQRQRPGPGSGDLVGDRGLEQRRTGEYEIGLTVTNSVEMTDSATIESTSICHGTISKSVATTAATRRTGYRRRRSLQQGGRKHHREGPNGAGVPQGRRRLHLLPGANNCRAELNIHAYNEEDEEASNTSTGVESRGGSDYDDDQDCIHLKLSGYMFSDTESTYGEGQWTMTIQNDRVNDFNIDRFVIRLYYK